MRNLFAKLIVLLGLVASASAADVSIKEGECWKYAARPGEEESFLVIRKIESLPKIGEVIHISVFGLKIKSPSAPTGFTDQIGHLPIAGANVRASLTKKVEKKIPNTSWKEGYQQWREAFDSEKAGVFKQSVGECITFVEQAVSHGTKE